MKKSLEEVIYVSWEESELGWGCRPDSCSLHLSEADYSLFLDKYWAGMPKAVPNEYSRPEGRPVIVKVCAKLYRQIKNSENGIRLWEGEEHEAAENGRLVYGKERSGWVAREVRA